MPAFSCEEEKWIILNGNDSPTRVMRKFCKVFNVPRNRQSKLSAKMFTRVIEKFKKTFGKAEPRYSRAAPVRSGNKDVVKSHFEMNPKSSIRDAACALEVSKSSVHRIIREDLKFYPYRIHKVHNLTTAHKDQRVKFCEWLLAQPDDFVQNVIWSDEKWFFKKTPSNTKNERIWSLVQPHEYEEQQEQGGEKVMAWVGVIDGRILPVYWFKKDGNRTVNVNGPLYGEMIEHIFPLIEQDVSSKQWWWQQDGATPHCTIVNLDLLKEKFNGRVISRRAEISWPSCSPDLNPLDFWFWGYCSGKLRKMELTSMQEVCEAVEDICRNTPEDMVRKSAAAVTTRARFCLQALGGHFQCSM